MDFPNCVKTCTANPTVGCSWWNQLCADANPAGDRDQKSADALRQNIELTNLFTLNGAYASQVASFCGALQNHPTETSVRQAAKAINETEEMVCAGPVAADLGSAPCRLIAFESYYRFNSLYGRADPDLVRRAWQRTSSAGGSEYDSNVNPAAHIRGQLPQSFWAPHADILALEARGTISLDRLRHFLGLHDDFAVGSFDGIGRALLIRIADGTGVAFNVPTGWDGFDNPYFRETRAFDARDVSTHYGATLDRATNRSGALEIVSKPIAGNHTQLLKCYQ